MNGADMKNGLRNLGPGEAFQMIAEHGMRFYNDFYIPDFKSDVKMGF